MKLIRNKIYEIGKISKEEISELAVEYALLKGLNNKDYTQLKRLRELEEMISLPLIT